MGKNLSGCVWRYRSEAEQRVALEEGAWADDALLKRLLACRALLAEAEEDNARGLWLFPSRAQSHDPMRMKGMDVALDVLQELIRKRSHVRIYGDYDADGMCSVSLVYRLLTKTPLSLSYALADRFTGGYGLSVGAVEAAASAGANALFVVDCGTSDLRAVAAARDLGLCVIICDHHIPGKELPWQMRCSIRSKAIVGIPKIP